MRDALCASEPGIGLAIQMIVLCLVALSAWLVLRVGRISLGQQAYFGIGGYCTALLTTVGQWPLDVALLAATLAAHALAATEHLHLVGADFGAVLFNAGLVRPLAGAQAAFHVDLAALFQILACKIGRAHV